MTRKTPNTILCCAGRRVELVHIFKAAHAALGTQGATIAVDADPLAPALYLSDRHYITPTLDRASFLTALKEICEREAPCLVFPLVDPAVPALARLRGHMESVGALLAGVGADGARIAEDKWETVAFFRSIGLATVPSWVPGAKPDITGPYIVKPRKGSAGKDVFRTDREEDLEDLCQNVREPIIQKFIEGPEITADVVCSTAGDIISVVCRQRIEVRGGEVTKAVTIHDERITTACQSIAKALSARGPITVQCFLTPDGPVFNEINARLGGGFPLGVAAGADSIKWLLSREADPDAFVPPVGSYRDGVFMTRYDQSVFLDQNQVDNVRSGSIRS